jgi:hypothetical protein
MVRQAPGAANGAAARTKCHHWQSSPEFDLSLARRGVRQKYFNSVCKLKFANRTSVFVAAARDVSLAASHVVTARHASRTRDENRDACNGSCAMHLPRLQRQALSR